MLDRDPISWTNWNWRRRLALLLRPANPKPKAKGRTEPRISPATYLSAFASVAAALAAGFSAYAAFRQTDAAYRSQLFSRQVDAVSELAKTGQDLLETQIQAHVFYKLHKGENHLPGKIADQLSSALLSWEAAVQKFDQIVPIDLGLAVQDIGSRMTANIRDRTFDHVGYLIANTMMDACLQRQLLLGFTLEAPSFQECFNRHPASQLTGKDE
jgi:hypothetical protein